MISTFPNKIFRLAMAAVLLAALALTVTPARAATTITLTASWDSLAGDGLCSLREAIIAANTDTAVDACPAGNGADTIILPAGQYDLTLAGINEDAALTGDLDITEDLILIGEGSATTTINANSIDRAFHIWTPVVEISGVTITVGDSGLGVGGGILNVYGMLTLTDSSVDGNTAEFSGGGIGNFMYAIVTITDSSVDGNTSGFGHGGGIFNHGTLTITNSSVDDNTAEYSGGGIFNTGTTTVTNSTVSGNSGGGIYNTELAYIGSSATVIITNSSVDGNTTGGGIVNENTLTVTDSTISNNTSSNAGGGIVNGSFESVSTATITNSTISGNSAALGGGVYNFSTVTITNSTLSGNSADFDGGGIYNGNVYSSATAIFTNSTLSGNTADDDGGGIFNDGGDIAIGTVKLHNVTISNNSADSDADGLGNGGGVFVSAGGTLNLGNSIIARNFDNSPVVQHPDCSGMLTSLGYNLIQKVNGCAMAGVGGNLFRMLPLLGPLQDNGGATWTMALLAGSPAIDAGNPAGCKDENLAVLTTDQRGYVRPVDGNGDNIIVCDMGAFEY